jgi:ABC-2 type transport system permease protein
MLFTLLSGAIVPLPLWPRSWQWLLHFLPFRALIDTPAQIYLGLISPARTLPLVGVQLIWTVAFVLAGRWLLGKAIKAVVVQGG